MHRRASCRKEVDEDEVVKRYIKSIGKGLLKVMSKMGISTYQSYCGAQIFDAVGLQVRLRQPRLLRHRDDDRRHRHGRGRGGERAAPPRRLRRCADLSPRARCRRRIRLPPARRGACLEPRHGRDAAARGAPQRAGPLPRIRPARERAGEASLKTIRGLFRIKHADEIGPRARRPRRGRAGEGDRQALLDRRHVLRLDLEGGARDAGPRHELHRRQVQHRRGRRGAGSLPAAARRTLQALRHQAGGVRPLRRDDRISRQCRHDADQDRAGRKARRRRPASRPQGRREDRPRAPFDARRRPDLAAAAPRHLLDRGSGAAHLRPEERQPGGRRLGEARLGSRRRHGRGGRREGARRPHHHLGLRGRHRRLAPDLHQACRLAVGDRPCRNPADPRAEPPARPRRARRPTAACAPGATWSSRRCSAPTSSASRPRR